MSLHEIELNEASNLWEMLKSTRKVKETFILEDIWSNLMTLTSPQYKRLFALIYNDKYEELFKTHL